METVSQSSVDGVFGKLLNQSTMSAERLERNLEIAEDAWKLGAGDDDDEENDASERLVFHSDTRVSALADTALKVWIEIFILGNGEYSDYVL